MIKYKAINDFESNHYHFIYKNRMEDLLPLLKLLEKVNPCNQEYEFTDSCFLISYSHKLNLFNFRNLFPLKANVQIIGLPVSVCMKGYFGNHVEIESIIKKKKGLKILLNGDNIFNSGGKTLSSFVFDNKFSTFDDYLNSLRSPYRRRINKALNFRNKLNIRKIDNNEFNENHYKLYLSIMKRTENPLETLLPDFFREYDAEIYEFSDVYTNDIIGFIQLKTINDTLYFLFGGFNKEDIKLYDIYYNMLLKIIEVGIENQVSTIEFGQTAEESKLKIGCREQYKYLYVHHSNFLLNSIIQKLLPLLSYKPYSIKHHVFKDNLYTKR
ncbi:hypothetical protein [Sedimentibacter sp.]|uniref:hypothetical protein n=1 Tax=Sedimentibacter sp. TaxID=1960295 RepID=UPI00289DE09F|nr:hypothetical protein [Sedimentibacter sp.]